MKGMARVIKIYWIDHELRAVSFLPKTYCRQRYFGFVTRNRKSALMGPKRDLCMSKNLSLNIKQQEYRILAEDKPNSEIKWGVFVPL